MLFILMVKYVLFTKISLLIIVSGVVIDDLNVINNICNKKYYKREHVI